MEIDRIVEEIYEAAIAPELWLRTLDRLAEIAGGEGTVLFAAHSEVSRAIASHALDARIRDILGPESTILNERNRRLLQIKEPRFLTDLDAFTLEELDQSRFYRDQLRPLGLGWCCWTAINSPTGDTLVFSIERAYEKGPVPQTAIQALDSLRPHLARACILSARAGLSRARSGVLALETVGLPAAVLSDKGKVLAFNGLFNQNVLGVAVGNGDVLKFRHKPTQANFTTLLAETGAELDGVRPGSFILRADADAKPHVAHLFPLGDIGRDVFTGASTLFYVTPLAGQATMPAELLQGLFDLTPAEANIARLIGEGNTISNVSLLLTIQESTVRVHLKSIFSKTGVRRQSELVRLVMLPSLKPPEL